MSTVTFLLLIIRQRVTSTSNVTTDKDPNALVPALVGIVAATAGVITTMEAADADGYVNGRYEANGESGTTNGYSWYSDSLGINVDLGNNVTAIGCRVSFSRDGSVNFSGC